MIFRKHFGLSAGQRADEFQTDTLQIRFDGVTPSVPPLSDPSFWLSFQAAFMASAADVLVIPTRELDGTYRRDNQCALTTTVATCRDAGVSFGFEVPVGVF